MSKKYSISDKVYIIIGIVALLYGFVYGPIKHQIWKAKMKEELCSTISNRITYNIAAKGGKKINVEYIIDNIKYERSDAFSCPNIDGQLKVEYNCKEPSYSRIIYDSIYYNDGHSESFLCNP